MSNGKVMIAHVIPGLINRLNQIGVILSYKNESILSKTV